MTSLEEEKLASSSNARVKPNSSNMLGSGVGIAGVDVCVGVAVTVGTGVGVGEAVGTGVTVDVGIGVQAGSGVGGRVLIATGVGA